jgi:predicted transcriptional regulator
LKKNLCEIVTFRLDEETRQRLDALAATTNRSRAQVIRLLLDAVVPLQPKEVFNEELDKPNPGA